MMISRLITVFTFIFGLTAVSNAQVIGQNYESFVTYADKIVRGKVVGTQRVNAYRGARTVSCGVYMEIEVTRSWKGGDENFLLYATNSDVFMGEQDGNLDREYFIFAFKNPKHSQTERSDEYVLCEGENSVKQNIAPFEYVSDSGVQRIFPIKKAEPRSIDEWMFVVNRHKNAILPEEIQKRPVRTGNTRIIEEMSLSQFTDTLVAPKTNN